ncbi:MAG TPA: carboxypeptidase regulatory-like domain-containing protein [Longimicrobiales bacterium]
MYAFVLHSAAILALAAFAAPAVQDTVRAPASQRTGSITGEVRVAPVPARRAAERYAGAVPATERPVQAVPAVVYLNATADAGAAERPRLRLTQKDTMFAPGALVVQTGTTVDFPNGDPFFHNVFSYSKPKRFDLGRYPRGESKSVRFDEPGTVKIYCEVHKSMRAMVVVVPSPYHAVVDESGRFSIGDVAPGRYELVVVDADRGTRTVGVTVTAGQTARVTVSLP